MNVTTVGHWLVSVPAVGAASDDNTYKNLASLVSANNMAEVSRFAVPDDLKIGALDTLISSSDALSRLDQQCEGYVLKIADVIKTILQGDQDKIEEQQVVNDTPVDLYLRSFKWNSTKYRTDRSIAELIDLFGKESASLDDDLRSKFSQYNQVKTTLTTFERRQTGNLSQRNLNDIVSQDSVVSGSDYMDTLFIAIPGNRVQDFAKSYETLTPMVVPRSATEVARDSEYHLYSVVVFKKYAQEFVSKCREMKCTPRDFTYDKVAMQRERKEYEEAKVSEKKLWGEVLRLGRAAFGDVFQAWIHVKAVRVFVESVLRYGLPAQFVCAVIKPNKKQEKALTKALESGYRYLGGTQYTEKKGSNKSRGGENGLQESINAVEGSLGLDDNYIPYVFFRINWGS